MGSEAFVEVSLADIADFRNGKAIPPEKHTADGKHPVFGSNGQIACSDEVLCPDPTIVIGRVGAYCGCVHFVPTASWVTDNAIVATPQEGNDIRYLYYLLGSLGLERTAIGSAQPLMTQKGLKVIQTKVPPLHEQKAIAHILGSLDDKIELNRRMNATLEGMAQALFKSWFVDFDPVLDNAILAGSPIPDEFAERAKVRRKLLEQNQNDECSVMNDELNESSTQNSSLRTHHSLFPAAFTHSVDLGWIPEGWEATPVSKCLEINPRLSLKKETKAPFVDMKALPTKGYSVTEVSSKEFKGGAKFQAGDTLFARITPCLQNGKTAIVDFLLEGDVGFGSTEFIILRGKGSIQTPFVASLARDSDFRKHCEQSMIGSTGRQRVHNSCFDSYHLGLPKNLEILDLFHHITSSKFERITANSNEVKSLSKLRDTLLPKLISGELSASA